MVQLSVIEAQLTRLGVRKTWFSRPEIRELQHILMDHERVIQFVSGRYQGGFAILVATEQRLLLIDKKPLYLTVEDIRYDMISEVDINARLFDATVLIYTVNKQLSFSSTKQRLLRRLIVYVQQRVMELRQYHPEATVVPIGQPQIDLHRSDPQTLSHAISAEVANQLAARRPHIPSSIPAALSHTRDYIPSHLSQAVGSAATKLASHVHNPNPYTKAPLMIRRRWSSWSNPSD